MLISVITHTHFTHISHTPTHIHTHIQNTHTHLPAIIPQQPPPPPPPPPPPRPFSAQATQKTSKVSARILHLFGLLSSDNNHTLEKHCGNDLKAQPACRDLKIRKKKLLLLRDLKKKQKNTHTEALQISIDDSFFIYFTRSSSSR